MFILLTEFIPYLKQHCNLSAMERAATTALREEQNISPEQAAYYNTVVAYVQDCRPLLNHGQYNLPEPPKLADFDQSLHCLLYTSVHPKGGSESRQTGCSPRLSAEKACSGQGKSLRCSQRQGKIHRCV